MELLGSELLLYGGAVLMVMAVAGAVLCAAVFSVSSRRLKRTLEQEYGKQRSGKCLES